MIALRYLIRTWRPWNPIRRLYRNPQCVGDPYFLFVWAEGSFTNSKFSEHIVFSVESITAKSMSSGYLLKVCTWAAVVRLKIKIFVKLCQLSTQIRNWELRLTSGFIVTYQLSRWLCLPYGRTSGRVLNEII